VAAGLISTTRHSPAGTPPIPPGPDHESPATHQEHALVTHPGHPPPTGPGRAPAAEPVVGGGAPIPVPPWPLTTTDPDVALLQRLRDALEAL
jgi:hypothetical protein